MMTGGKANYLLTSSGGAVVELESTLSSGGESSYASNSMKLPQQSPAYQQQQLPTPQQSSSLPPALKIKLYELFGQIEKEFEVLYSENMGLQERVDSLNSQAAATCQAINSMTGSPSTSTLTSATINKQQQQQHYSCHFDNSFNAVKQQQPAQPPVRKTTHWEEDMVDMVFYIVELTTFDNDSF